MKPTRSLFFAVLITFYASLPVTADVFPPGCQTLGQTVSVHKSGNVLFASGNVYLRTDKGIIDVRERKITSQRIRFTLPRRKLHSGQAFSIVSRQRDGADIVLGSGRVCPGDQTDIPKDVVTTANGELEYVISGTRNDLRRTVSLLNTDGIKVLRTVNLTRLDMALLFLTTSLENPIETIQRRLRSKGIPSHIDLHHKYFLESGSNERSGFQSANTSSRCTFRSVVTVGILDGRINPRHQSLRNVDIIRQNFVRVAGSADHATAVAYLILGQEPFGNPALNGRGTRNSRNLSNLKIISANVFAPSQEDGEAKLEDISVGLDWLMSKDVDLINMSFSGATNRIFEQILDGVKKHGIILVSAVGNDGHRKVSFPASSDNVLAVTAVDSQNRLYRMANTGREVAFAAPGVELFVPRRNGFAYETGTSFASAVITGIIAQQLAQGVDISDNNFRLLRRRATDLGTPGKDLKFGYGSVSNERCATD